MDPVQTSNRPHYAKRAQRPGMLWRGHDHPETYDIHCNDIILSINDTTNMSIVIGQLIS